ncbi:MAG: DUF3887 domain-containing protein [Lachnospiraceae bacterium]|nr:DUF3887 domain-containing protein [Lachnospiraceae bacterium]
MDAEKYVKKIVRNLKCTGAKKKEIGDSLLSDIAARREQGEAMEQIMESMGSPEEIAEAFSQNLSDADRKAYKRRRIGMTIGQIVAALVFLSVLAWWMIPKPAALGDDLSQEAVTASVENVIVMLNQNDFDGLQELAVDELKSKLTQETLDEVRKGISEDWGEMQSIGKVYMQGLKQKGKVMVVTQVDAVYENVSVVYTISFDEDLRLGGLYMR